MLKPLFAPPAKRRREIELSFGDEPILHSFVLRLCEAVKAPRPTVIEVDCDLGATAYFRNGWWGFFTNDFVIRIGLPLISTLDTRQLGGVLAHELSHFSQRAGMRLSYVIRSINDWLYQVAFEEDAWDEAITEWGEHENNWISILANFSHMFVILGQILLMFLYIIGHVASCALLRQMEYDADKFGTRLAGSDTFEATARRLMELTLAKSLTERISKENEGEGRIPDNLPLCLATIFRSLPSTVNVNEMTDSLIESGRTGWFYSEPAYRDRIRAAHRQQAPGIFHLERPAKVLMRNLTKTAEAATLIHYNRLIGKSAVKRQLTTTPQFLSRLGLD
jgi:Zn-dependent protease with chaperone function